MTAVVVADASPLIALQQIGMLDLLRSEFGEVVVPPAVAREIRPSVPSLPWITERPLGQPLASRVLRASLGPGESEALSLAVELTPFASLRRVITISGTADHHPGTGDHDHRITHPTGLPTNPRYIINFPTKRHWRGRSRIEDIEAGLEALVAEIRRLGLRSVAVPPLGCGKRWPRLARCGAADPACARHDPTVSRPADAARSVHAWNERKRRMFPANHISVAWEQLVAQGWLPTPGHTQATDSPAASN